MKEAFVGGVMGRVEMSRGGKNASPSRTHQGELQALPFPLFRVQPHE